VSEGAGEVVRTTPVIRGKTLANFSTHYLGLAAAGSLAFGGGYFLCASYWSSRGVARSVDGITWEPVGAVVRDWGSTASIIYDAVNATWIAIGSSFAATVLEISTDNGTSWHSSGTLQSSSIHSAGCDGNGRVIVTGTDGTCSYSTDGCVAFTHVANITGLFPGVVSCPQFCNGVWAIGSLTTNTPLIFSVDNGVTWQNNTNIQTNNNAVTAAKSRFICSFTDSSNNYSVNSGSPFEGWYHFKSEWWQWRYSVMPVRDTDHLIVKNTLTGAMFYSTNGFDLVSLVGGTITGLTGQGSAFGESAAYGNGIYVARYSSDSVCTWTGFEDVAITSVTE